jgi:predicted negative regulator of RcsB-dependent stress response
MATEVKQPEVIVPKSSEEKLVQSTKDFWSKNSKLIVYVLTAAILLVGGYIVYNNYFKAPAESARMN